MAEHPADRSLDVPVVDDPSDLTPAWLTHALRSAGHDATVHAVTVEPVGTGQMGSSFRLTLDVTEQSPTPSGPIPRTLVAKLPTSDVEARVAIASSHRTEVTFYRDVASTIAARTPQCHLALVSEDATCFTLLLEDLAPAAQGDQLAGCTTEQLVTAAHNLAGLHGPRWCDPDIVALRGPLDAADPDTAAFLGEVLAGAVAPFAERMGDAVSPADVALLHECAAAMPHFLVGRPERFSLMHGDYRLDNLMFHPDGTVAAVDWQTLGVGLAGRDLAYLIATSLEPDARREAEARCDRRVPRPARRADRRCRHGARRCGHHVRRLPVRTAARAAHHRPGGRVRLVDDPRRRDVRDDDGPRVRRHPRPQHALAHQLTGSVPREAHSSRSFAGQNEPPARTPRVLGMTTTEPERIDCTRVGTEFFATAPCRVRVREVVPAPPLRVFDVFADADSWSRWAMPITGVEWTSPWPLEVGSTRTVRMRGGMVGWEEFIAWEPPRRMAFRFNESVAGGPIAFAEDYHLTDLGNGSTRIEWIMAMELSGVSGKLTPVIRSAMQVGNRLMLRKLRNYIASNPSLADPSGAWAQPAD